MRFPRPRLAAAAASLLLAAGPAPGFRGDGARELARGLAYLAGRPDRGILGEAEAAALAGLPAATRLARARTCLTAARESAVGARERTEATLRLVEALEAQAAAARKDGDSPVRIEALRAARDLAPGRAALGLGLARALVEGGDRPGAAAELARLGAEPGLAPGSRAEVLRELARVDEQLGELGRPGALEEALGAWRTLAKDEDPATRTTALARQAALAARLDRPEEAVEAYGRLAELRELSREEAREYLLARGSHRARRDGALSRAGPDPHFEVQVEEPGREAAAEAVRELFEAAREELGGRLEAFPEGALLVRVIPAQRFRRQVAPGLEAVQRASGVVLKLDLEKSLAGYRPVVFHEYAHYLVRQKTAGHLPPRWLNEGIAMLCEGGALPLAWYKRVSTARKQGALLDAAGLAAFGAGAPGGLPQAYAEAALLTEHLVEARGAGVLPRLLEAFAEGLTPDQALAKASGFDGPGLLDSWREAWADQLRRRLAGGTARRAPEPDRSPWADEGEGAEATASARPSAAGQGAPAAGQSSGP